jgi:2,4-dienoyl-CoA reductase-like NADH-dependent reductase (Old Yellow Enzyme family)
MVNKRDDQYGNQNKENRTRLLLEAFDAIAEVFGAELVGVRIAPFGSFNSMPQDAKVEETFLFLANELSRRNAAYVHLVLGHPKRVVPDEFLPKLRSAFHGTIMVNGGLTKETAQALLDEDKADLFAFGRLFIANPDLPERFKNDWPLAEPDPKTFYGGDAEGYTDYPEFAG